MVCKYLTAFTCFISLHHSIQPLSSLFFMCSICIFLFFFPHSIYTCFQNSCFLARFLERLKPHHQMLFTHLLLRLRLHRRKCVALCSRCLSFSSGRRAPHSCCSSTCCASSACLMCLRRLWCSCSTLLFSLWLHCVHPCVLSSALTLSPGFLPLRRRAYELIAASELIFFINICNVMYQYGPWRYRKYFSLSFFYMLDFLHALILDS